LRKLLKPQKGSLVYLALCGVSIIGYSEISVADAVASLRLYLQKCMDRGYLPESAYVSDTIEQIKQEQRELNEPDYEGEAAHVRRQLEAAQNIQDTLEVSWRNRLAQIESEERIAIEDLRMRWEDACESLEAEWNSEKVKSKFNKPSPKLIDLRKTAKRMLSVRRFEEAALLAKEIANLEMVEASDAERNMNLAYRVAVERLDRKFANDLETLRASFVTRRNQAERSRDVTMKPVIRSVDKYRYREGLLSERKKQSRIGCRSSSVTIRSGIPPDTTIASKGAKLKLPDVRKARRRALLSRPCSALSGSRTSSTVGSSSALGSLDSGND
jgi:hypothetical protein